MLTKDWWHNLSSEWQQAFAEVFFGHKAEPTDNELVQLFACEVLRFAGPKAPYPNMSFELSNLSGLACLTNLQVLVATHHSLQTLAELAPLTNLKSLFLYNNQISSLKGIESLTSLEQLYVQFNNIESLEPLQNLTNVKELFVHDNRLHSLQGLTETHADQLERFYCKPNDQLKQKELLRIEHTLGIRCQSL